MKVICEDTVCFLCYCIYPQAALVFVVGSSVAGPSSQKDNADVIIMHQSVICIDGNDSESYCLDDNYYSISREFLI
jgi:hypothetical protein